MSFGRLEKLFEEPIEFGDLVSLSKKNQFFPRINHEPPLFLCIATFPSCAPISRNKRGAVAARVRLDIIAASNQRNCFNSGIAEIRWATGLLNRFPCLPRRLFVLPDWTRRPRGSILGAHPVCFLSSESSRRGTGAAASVPLCHSSEAFTEMKRGKLICLL